jgi:hypothetical protein
MIIASANVKRSVRALRAAGLVAIGAALACAVGDLALQYTPNSRDLFAPDYRELASIPEWRLLLGHYLGVVALPLQLAGMWLMYQALLPAGQHLAGPIACLGGYSVAVGPALHSMFAILALLVQAEVGAAPGTRPAVASALERAGPFVNPLGAVILTAILVTYLSYAIVVGFRPTRLPRWMALCNPVTFLMLEALLALAVPGVALVVVPAGLNLAHLGFYLLLTILLWNGGHTCSTPAETPASSESNLPPI